MALQAKKCLESTFVMMNFWTEMGLFFYGPLCTSWATWGVDCENEQGDTMRATPKARLLGMHKAKQGANLTGRKSTAISLATSAI